MVTNVDDGSQSLKDSDFALLVCVLLNRHIAVRECHEGVSPVGVFVMALVGFPDAKVIIPVPGVRFQMCYADRTTLFVKFAFRELSADSLDRITLVG